jgi:hypothetical protein
MEIEDMYKEQVGQFLSINVSMAWNKVLFFYESVDYNLDCIVAIQL